MAAALSWLGAVAALPSDPNGWSVYGLASVPVELAVLVLALAWLPRLSRAPWLPHAVAIAAVIVIALKLADLAIQMSLGRWMNLYVDRSLWRPAAELAIGNFGAVATFLAALAAAAAFAAAYRATLWSVGMLQAVIGRGRRTGFAIAASVAVAMFALQRVDPDIYGPARPVNAIAGHMVMDQVQMALAARAAEGPFLGAAAEDPLAGLPNESLFQGLAGADVVLIFFESYGRNALSDPDLSTGTLEALGDAQRTFDANGFAAASGWLRSPTLGGQSWLAHASVASGLWIEDQNLYDLLLASLRDDGARRPLPELFAAVGYETLVVAPAIVRDWPDAARFGFRRAYGAADLGYGGKPVGWVTMPDQFTLAAFDRIRRSVGPVPVFAEIDLLSSHAPWPPMPPIVANWDAIGDGGVFNEFVEATASAVASDTERIRVAYGRSIDYVIRTLSSYAAHLPGDPALIIVVGDHPPSPIISAGLGGTDVPIHVFSRDPALIRPFAAWGFSPGLVPDAASPVHPMSDLRTFLALAFSRS
jgi:hypothetical protein